MGTPTMSAKAQWTLGVSTEEVESKSQQSSRPASRLLRSSRSSVSNEHTKSFQSTSNSANVSRTPSTAANGQKAMSRFAKARKALSRHQSPERSGSQNHYSGYLAQQRGPPTPNVKSAFASSYSTPRRSPTRGSQPRRHNASEDITSTDHTSEPAPPIPLSEHYPSGKPAGRMSLLSKLSLRSRKSRASMNDQNNLPMQKPLPPIPHTTGHSPRQSTVGLATTTLGPVQPSSSQNVHAQKVPNTQKPRASQSNSKPQQRNWFDGVEEEDEDEMVEASRVSQPPPHAYSPASITSIPDERQSIAPSSVVDETTLHSVMLYNDDYGYARTSRDYYGTDRIVPNFSIPTIPQQASTNPSDPTTSGQPGLLPLESRGLQSRNTMRSAFGPGESVLSLSDSEDSDNTPQSLAKPLKPKQQPPINDTSTREVTKGVKSKSAQRSRGAKPKSPTMTRNGRMPPIEEPEMASSIRSTSVYLASSSKENSPDQTPLSSPILQEPDQNARTSWLSSTANPFPHPPSQIKPKNRKPANIDISKASKPTRDGSSNTLSPSVSGLNTGSSQSSTPSHHIMAVTAEEAMLISSMRRKRATMHQQLFSEGYRTALQEELRIMENLRLEEIGVKTPSDKPQSPQAQPPQQSSHKAKKSPSKLDDGCVVELAVPAHDYFPPQSPNRGRPVDAKPVTAAKADTPQQTDPHEVMMPTTTEHTDFATFDPPRSAEVSSNHAATPFDDIVTPSTLPLAPASERTHSASFSDFSGDFTTQPEPPHPAAYSSPQPTPRSRLPAELERDMQAQRQQQQQQQPLQAQRPRSNRHSRLPISVHPPSRQSGTWERASKRSSVARDVLAAWDDLGGGRESGTSLAFS